jgi:hypothetical protein
VWLAAAVAFLVAFAVVGLELVTSKYPYTAFVLTPIKCWACYLYVFIFAVIAAGIVLALDYLEAEKILRLEGVGLGTKVGEAIYVGVAVKALLNIRIFDTRSGTPVGIASLVQIFEPWLLNQLALQEWNAVREFVSPRARKYEDLTQVRRRIRENMPPHLDEEENKALELDVEEKLEEVPEIMERYLKKTGRRTFKRVFPL